MLNIHDLERRWLRYKIKSYIPYALASIGGILVIVALSLFLPQSKKGLTQDLAVESVPKIVAQVETKPEAVQKEIVEVKIEVPENTNSQESIYINTNEEVNTRKKETLVLKPSLHFMDNIEEGISPYVDEDYMMQESPTKNDTNSDSTTQPVQETIAVKQEETKPKVSSLTITRHQEKSDLKDVIRRFKKNKNPALSLFIAKRYYADGNYQKSYNYALMTNEIDKKIDESWIIFAKSLVKLGQHELAINTLKSYLKDTKSSAASVLLRKIEGGSFR